MAYNDLTYWYPKETVNKSFHSSQLHYPWRPMPARTTATSITQYCRSSALQKSLALTTTTSIIRDGTMLDCQHFYCTSQIRRTLNKALRITPAAVPQVSQARAIQMNLLEELINELIDQMSGMERIGLTPVPISMLLI